MGFVPASSDGRGLDIGRHVTRHEERSEARILLMSAIVRYMHVHSVSNHSCTKYRKFCLNKHAPSYREGNETDHSIDTNKKREVAEAAHLVGQVQRSRPPAEAISTQHDNFLPAIFSHHHNSLPHHPSTTEHIPKKRSRHAPNAIREARAGADATRGDRARRDWAC